MEPWVSWPIFISIGAGAYYYYSQSGKARSGGAQGKDKQQKDSIQKRQDKKQDGNSASATQDGRGTPRSDSNQSRKRPQPRDQKSEQATTSAREVKDTPSRHAEVDNEDQEWAKQLQAAQQGVTMKSTTGGQGASGRSTQQQGIPNLSAREVDENARPANTTRAPASQDVSDMLEPAPAAPSAIRITGEEKAKKQLPKKEEPEKETKKQRQNRKKVEERKTAREEEEKERKVLEERQRRAAREARGEPAKNGLGVAQPPTSNAWSKPNNSNDTNASRQNLKTADNPLLDTFDQDARSTTSSNDQQQSIYTPATGGSISSQELLSEEAQLQAIKEMNGDAGWNEVKKSKKGKKKAPGSPPAEPGVREASSAQVSLPSASNEAINGASKAPGLPNKSTQPANDYAALRPATTLKPSVKAHPDDSDWAVE